MDKVGIILIDFDAQGGLEIVSYRLMNGFKSRGIMCMLYSCFPSVNQDVKSFNIDRKNHRLNGENIDEILSTIRIDGITNLIIQAQSPNCLLSNLSLIKGLAKIAKLFYVLHNSPKYFVRRYRMHRENFLVFLLKNLKTIFYWKPRGIIFCKKARKLGIHFVTISKGNKKEFQKFFGITSICIPNYFDSLEFSEDIFIKKEKIVTFLGRIDYEQKNLFFLLKVWALVKHKNDWKLFIIGKGDSVLLKRFVNSKNINNVIFIPGLSSHDANMHLAKSSITVLASKYEGFPTVLVEAAFLANAIVSTKYDGFSEEILKDEKNGFVTSFNTKLFAEKLERLIFDKTLLKYMQCNSKRIADEYLKDDVIQCWLNTFQNLISDCCHVEC